MKGFSFLSCAAITCIFMTACQHNSTVTAANTFPDTAGMDRIVRPADNFYRFVNGKWIQHTIIPPTESQAGTLFDIYNGTRARLHDILDSVSKGSYTAGSIEQKTGDFYASGMDSATINANGYQPVKPVLDQVNQLTSSAAIMPFVEKQATEGNDFLLGAGIGADEKNSAMNIASFSQDGLGLPDRDYYFKTDAATASVVAAYKTYIEKLLTLTGQDSTAARSEATKVYQLEKQMAKSHKTNVELRDPQANYHKMAVTELDTQMPALHWKQVFSNLGYHTDSADIRQPAYFGTLDTLLTAVPLADWKAYLRFHVVNAAANALSEPFVVARFNFTKVLSGQQQMKPRWERIYLATDANLGDALGQIYVSKYFTSEAKSRMLTLVNNLQAAFEARIKKLDWMSDSTKAIAITKLHAFTKKIGYPDKWRDYSKVKIDRQQYFNNRVACAENEYQYQLSKLGKPVDKTEWGFTAPTVNAYYNPTFNEIVFPAGILQSPLFDPTVDDAVNYGGIGSVIGHEMTHGFDDQGAQYTKEGNLQNWWNQGDKDKFKTKTGQIAGMYDKFVMLDSLHVNGALTTGENMADFGGLNLSWDAFKLTKEGHDSTRINGYTPDQRFFIAYAQVWRSKYKDEIVRQYLNIDPHSPDMYRVNGPLMHFAPFYNAFDVQQGDKMFVPGKDRITIW